MEYLLLFRFIVFAALKFRFRDLNLLKFLESYFTFFQHKIWVMKKITHYLWNLLHLFLLETYLLMVNILNFFFFLFLLPDLFEFLFFLVNLLREIYLDQQLLIFKEFDHPLVFLVQLLFWTMFFHILQFFDNLWPCLNINQ